MTTPFQHPRTRRQALAVLGAASLLAAAACGGGSSDSSSPSSSAGTKLSLSILGSPPSFDVTQINEGQGRYIWDAVYDTLLYTDNKGEIQPNAAEKYAYSDDRKTLTLTLRKGMTFTSGAPVNAAAVKATLDRIRSNPGQIQVMLAPVDSIEAPDESTVVLKLKAPNAALLGNLTSGAGIIADPATMTRPNAATEPVGSGPYAIDKATTVAGSAYTLKKRKDYWNSAAYPFETVRVRVMGDRNAVTNALLAGELNAGATDFTQSSALKAKGLTLTPVKATAAAQIVLADRNGESAKPLGDLKVRQAINMAFDRTKLSEMYLRGSGQATAQVYSPLGKAYDAELDKVYSFDTTKAKRMMAEAGYADGFSITMPSFATTKIFEPTVAQGLADIGIKVTWTPVPPQQAASALAAKKFPMFFTIDGLSTDAVLTNGLFTVSNARNPFKVTDPVLTKLIDEANAADDPTPFYRKINEFGVKNAWFAPIFDIGAIWATGKGVKYLGDGSNGASTIRAFGTE